jgi:hypothetical protein
LRPFYINIFIYYYNRPIEHQSSNYVPLIIEIKRDNVKTGTNGKSDELILIIHGRRYLSKIKYKEIYIDMMEETSGQELQ